MTETGFDGIAGACNITDEDTLERASGLFRALGDPTRLKIINALLQGNMKVADIAGSLHMTQSAISHQLSTLKALHIVRSRREGKSVYYSLDDEHVKKLYQQCVEHVRHS